MLGTKFGLLTVTGVAGPRGGLWACRCDCGNDVVLMRCLVLSGNTKSCGCKKHKPTSAKHGEVRRINGKRVPSPEYRAWQNMRNRCLNTGSQDWPYYGGRGVTLDPSWNTFETFLLDMGRRPSNLHTIDRIDGDGPYCKDNCRWATRQTQSRNRKCSSVKAWEIAEQLGLSQKTVYHMMWECREKDKGNLKYFTLSPENEARIRPYMERSQCV